MKAGGHPDPPAAGARLRGVPGPRFAGCPGPKRPRLDKLGVKPGARVALVGHRDAAFRRELLARTRDVSEGRLRRGSDLIFFAVVGPAALARLATLQRAIQRDGAIWVLWPKGRKEIKEDLIRDAALRHGLVDVKVVAYSETLSGLKLVIPVAKR